MKLDLYSKIGKKTEKSVNLDTTVFEAPINESLLTQAVYIYLANQRESNASTKNRGEVSGGGRKPWKQKGTGRARHGSNRSPIWRGGGITFGPTNERNYKKEMTKKMRKLALISAFSTKCKEKEVMIMENFVPKKTKDVIDILENLKISDNKITFLQVKEEGIYKTAKNIANVDVKTIGEISTFDILNAGKLIILENSLDEISKRWGNEKKSVKTEVTKVEKKEKPEKITVKKETKKSSKK